jgi:hypothetical protein
MTINVRRVVTGHDDQGRAKVLIDETVRTWPRSVPARSIA